MNKDTRAHQCLDFSMPMTAQGWVTETAWVSETAGCGGSWPRSATSFWITPGRHWIQLVL